MNILKILNPDGSMYWQEHFNSEKDLDTWLAEEKTRPYWNQDFICEVETIELPQIDEEQIKKAIEDKEIKRKSAIDKLKALGLDAEEISALLE